MASESPQTDEFSNQEESHQTDPSDNNFPDEDIDPNAPTQYIENDNTNDHQVSFDGSSFSVRELSFKIFPNSILFSIKFRVNILPY